MPISLRLDDHAERIVRRVAKRTGRTQSDVIRQAIADLERSDVRAAKELPTAFERVAHLVGAVGSGGRDLSRDTGSAFRRIVEAKHRARGAR